MLVACNVCQNVTCKTWVKRYTYTYEDVTTTGGKRDFETIYSSYVIKSLGFWIKLDINYDKTPDIYNVPGLKCHLIIPPTLVLVDHFSYLTRNILTYTVQIHAIVNPHTQKTIHKLRISLFICRNLCWSGGWNTETCIIRKWTLPFINFDVFHYFSSSRQNIFR